MSAPLEMIVARAANGVIGNAGTIPWHIPEDLRHFKTVTMGAAVIMGRKTRESIGRNLPGRTNIVISRNAATHYDAEIAAECAGDTTFPELPASEWKKTVLREVPATDTTPMLTFCRYDRI